MKGAKGFTLLEVVIAVGILAVLSLLTGQAIQNAVRDKNRIQKNIDHSSALRSAFKVIERDIHMAFHFKDLNQEVNKKIKTERQKKQAQGDGNVNPNAFDNPTGGAEQINTTQFLGDQEQVHFTALNHIRMFAESRESDQQEVGYYIAQCRRLGKPDESTNCLWRRSTPYIDEKIDEGGSARVLLEDVTKLEFRYYSVEKQDWVQEWRSGEGADATTKDKFPDAVEVILETTVNDRPLMLTSVVPIRHPNNVDLKDKVQDPNSPQGNPNDPARN